MQKALTLIELRDQLNIIIEETGAPGSPVGIALEEENKLRMVYAAGSMWQPTDQAQKVMAVFLRLTQIGTDTATIIVSEVPMSVAAKIEELAPAHGYRRDWRLMARDLLWQAAEPDSFTQELSQREARKHAGRTTSQG